MATLHNLKKFKETIYEIRIYIMHLDLFILLILG